MTDPAAVWLDLDDLEPWADNPRDHTAAHVEEVAISIARFGFTSPIVARPSDRRIVAGHRRALAAALLRREVVVVVDGARWQVRPRTPADPPWRLPDAPRPGVVPVRFVELDDVQAGAATLVDNQLTRKSGWNDAALAAALRSLGEYRLGLGWDAAEIAAILARDSARKRSTTEIPASVREAGVAPGAYPIGDSLLVVGDAEERVTWAAIDAWLDGRTIDHVLTDPPYRVGYDGGGGIDGNRRSKTRGAHDLEGDLVLPDLALVFAEAARRQRPGGSWHVFGPPGPDAADVFLALRKLDAHRHTWVWAKGQAVIGRSDRHYAHEQIAYGWLPGAAHRWNGGRSKRSILDFPKPHASEFHPTQKPVELLVELLGDVAVAGEIVLDPFAGSGSTLAAALEVGLRAVLVEVDPHFGAVILARFGALPDAE